MLDVRVSEDTDPEALVAFVERLAGSGRGGPATAAARSRLVADLRGGRVPAGLRRLSTALGSGPAGAGGDRERAGSLAGAVAEEPLIVLSETGPGELAAALAELAGRGMRIVLTAAQAERLAAVRAALPSSAAGRVLDRLPALPSADLRRLRRLLATAGAERTRRAALQVPAEDALPAVADVTGCCARARRVVDGTDEGGSDEARIVPGLLRELECDRRAAVTQVARCTLKRLAEIDRSADGPQLREITGRLVHSGLRTEFESLQGLAARQRDDRAQYASTPAVEQLAAVSDEGEQAIRRYLDFLENGGRSRSYFKGPEQKAAEPLLRSFRTDGQEPLVYGEVLAVARHLHLAHRDDEIARLCAVLDLPVPRSTEDLPALHASLEKIAAAARSVGALRHDVLFLQQDSPVSVPDLAAAERVARAIVDYDDHGDPAEAGDELDRLAQECETAVPDEARTPEHDAVVEALRAHDVQAYTAALDELGRVRRELADAAELDRLLDELGRGHADLAAAWSADAADGAHGFGFLQVVGVDTLLGALPQADAADLVVVLGAGALQADGLLLTAAAPRLLAVVGDEPRAESAGTTLLEVLNQASARFLRGTGDGPQDVPAVPPAASVPEQAGPVEPGPDPASAVPAPRPATVAVEEQNRPSTPSAMAPARRGPTTG